MITTDSSRKHPEDFFSDTIRDANQLLQDSCDVVRECMNDTQKAFTEAVHGVLCMLYLVMRIQFCGESNFFGKIHP